ncbi:ABC transporter ATP-binding protein [Oceanomicrobium pacificus]|uniref:ATP-binding cassette domain-containing protein n=1 Tax=Oceanomicrobium pacificus TaxID=2692916 RepID=A0A6B0TJ18_9RHOB|nr:ABC transporter ATP-binding protein [Oceanomicrobium pacificus]MXU63866.1 ATP-binding cassette domain-containing protein [Oceanomicrobium pacificus]
MLELERITAFYGASQALFDVSLSLGTGEALALLGRNGMGKSTTIRAICGLTPPRDGQIRLDGQAIGGQPSHRIARAGIGLVPEGRRIFPNLTVAENLTAAARPGYWDRARVEALFPRLGERRGQYGHSLSGGEQQMLAIGRALTTNPRLLILDEATEGLAPVIRQEIWTALRRLKDEGLSLLIVDKILAELLPIADRCTILEKGVSVWSGAPDGLDPATRDRFLGV